MVADIFTPFFHSHSHEYNLNNCLDIQVIDLVIYLLLNILVVSKVSNAHYNLQ